MEDTKLLARDWDRIQNISRYYPRIAARLFRNLAALAYSRYAENTLPITDQRDDIQLDGSLSQARTVRGDVDQLWPSRQIVTSLDSNTASCNAPQKFVR